jgi:ABC-type lipoprotein release transport system permease subunit
VGSVVLITSFYETGRQAVEEEVVRRWFGNAHLTVHPPGAHWGGFDASLAGRVAQLPNVRHVTVRLKRRARLIRAEQAGQLAQNVWMLVDAIGIEPQTQSHFHTPSDVEGRTIRPGELGVAVIERRLAQFDSAELGDEVYLTPRRGGKPFKLQVVGIYASEDVAGFQRPSVYMAIDDAREFANEPSAGTAIDIMLEDSSPAALAAAQTGLEQLIAESDKRYQYQVESAAGCQQLLVEADRVTRVLLMLAAFVALLTSFFIILTTMSISIFERRTQFGVMRCIGLSRAQLAGLLFIELLPLGLFGTAAGLVLGVAVARLAPHWAGVPVTIRLSSWGISLAAASGIITTLASASILVLQVGRVTPLTAVRPHAVPARRSYAFVAAAAGTMLLLGHEGIIRLADQTRWINPLFSGIGVGTLYLGYVLMAPAVVVLTGPLIARVVGPLLGLRARLVLDQFGKAPWRSGGVCWVLMVGLSLIVYMGIGSEAIFAVWDIPARLPETFVWSRKYVPYEAVERARNLPGVGDSTIVADVDCEISQPDDAPRSATHALMRKFWHMLARPVFVAGEAAELLDMVKVSVLEGSLAQAKEKLLRGGYVLIPVQTSRVKNLHLGDRITITIHERTADFEIAGVIQSPALDLTATAFQAHSYMQFAAASVVLGTRRDLKEKFELDVASLILCDLDLSAVKPPPDFHLQRLPEVTDNRGLAQALLRWGKHLPEESESLARIGPQLETWLESGEGAALPTDVVDPLSRFAKAVQKVHWWSDRVSPEVGWAMLRETLVLQRMAQTMNRPEATVGSLRRAKAFFDKAMHRALGVVTYLPSIAFTVAVIGIANLMMVSVHLRSRQIAVLRAVGAFKSQIVRLVLAEAVSLGVLGSVMGVALGIHEAYSDNRVSGELIGFYPEFIIPVGTVAVAVVITILTCLLAGILPARYAARENIIAAMQTT